MLKLMFGRGGTEARWQVQADSLDYSISSRHSDSIADQQLLKLIGEISFITGIGFNEIGVEHVTQADVALFAASYRDAGEFNQWQASVSELHELVSSRRGTNPFSQFESSFAASMIQPRSGASKDHQKPLESHMQDGHPNCRFVGRFTAGANNWAMSAFGQGGMQLSPGPMHICFLRSFLSVVGLRGLRRLADGDLIEENRQGEVHLSRLVTCALEVLYHPTLATKVTLEDRSTDKAKRILTNKEVCR
ncbi:MAG: hypothetical protein ACFB0Z_00480 [Candidatus Phaeomarinobacter sp.]